MSVMQKLPAGTPTLSTMLDQLGYRSGTIQTNQHVTQASGYGEGVDYFEFLFAQPAGLITTKALDFIRDGDGPWFLYAHYIDPHAGYDPPEPHRSAFGPLPEMTPEEVEWLDDNNYHTGYYMDRFKYDVEFIQERQYGEFSDSAKEAIRQLYDGECRYTDAELKRLIEAVQAEYPQTLIVITSDHGEEFWEHGSIGHAKTVYEELSNVPLIVVGPGVAPTVVESPVSTLDITPTVARYLGTEFNPLAQGSDLLTPRSATAPAYTSTKGSIPEFKLDAASVVEWPFKLVEDRKRGWTRLFDLVADPGEKTDISESNPDMKSKLETALAAHKTSVEKGTAVETTAVSEEEMKALESLGYVGNSQAPENNGKDCEGEGEGTCEGETP